MTKHKSPKIAGLTRAGVRKRLELSFSLAFESRYTVAEGVEIHALLADLQARLARQRDATGETKADFEVFVIPNAEPSEASTWDPSMATPHAGSCATCPSRSTPPVDTSCFTGTVD